MTAVKQAAYSKAADPATSNDLSPRRVLDNGMTHVMAPGYRQKATGQKAKSHRQKATRQKATETKGHGTKDHRTQRQDATELSRCARTTTSGFKNSGTNCTLCFICASM